MRLVRNSATSGGGTPPDELKRWAARPLAQIAYIVEGEARTKRGTKLGVVTTYAVSTPSVRGVRMASIRVKGTNGARYYGRLDADGGGFCLLRKLKD
jgi:hypothetical protein